MTILGKQHWLGDSRYKSSDLCMVVEGIINSKVIEKMIIKILLIVIACLVAVAVLTIAYLFYMVSKLPKVKANGIRIACIGDSITQGMGVAFNNPDKNSYPALLQGMLGSQYQILNYGHSGRTLLRSGDQPYRESPFFSASLKSEPAIVFIMLGSNDSKPHNWNALEYERELADLVRLYQDLASQPSVYLLIPPPAFIPKGKKEVAFKISDAVIEKEILPAVQRVAGQLNIPIIDIFAALRDHPEFFPDGVHPNANGDKVIAQTVHQKILNLTNQGL